MLTPTMSGEIHESDWRLFRQLHPFVRDTFCDSILREITRVASDAAKTPHERYLKIYKLVQEKDRLLADAFNSPRRSTVLSRLAMIHSHGLFTEEEITRFSAEARDAFTRYKLI